MRSLLLLLALLAFDCGVVANATTLSVVSMDLDGQQITFANANSGGNDLAPNANGDVFVVVFDNGASAATVTFTPQDTSLNVPGFGDVEQSAKVVTLAAGEYWVAGPFPPTIWNNSSNL